MAESITINSFNTRGLGDKVKRKLVFDWLKEQHKGIILLQETHSTPDQEVAWERQWGASIHFSHGESNSGGVAILLPHNQQYTFKQILADKKGRILILEMEIEDKNFILGNVYDKVDKQLNFLNILRQMITKYSEIIIGGDFNVCLNPDLDKKGGREETESKYAKEVNVFQNDFLLVDIWRLRHPTLRRFTRRQKAVGGFVQSRLDFWLVSSHLNNAINKVEIHPGRRSDHSIISLAIQSQDMDTRGRGFWKLNTSLLQDSAYVKKNT